MPRTYAKDKQAPPYGPKRELWWLQLLLRHGSPVSLSLSLPLPLTLLILRIFLALGESSDAGVLPFLGGMVFVSFCPVECS